ncbi:unnamed protein product, partial [Ectocarpus sp. 12 AP-2014]
PGLRQRSQFFFLFLVGCIAISSTPQDLHCTPTRSLQHLSAQYVPDKLSSFQHTVPQRHRLGAVSCSFTTQAGLKTTTRTYASPLISVTNASVTALLFFR